MTNSGTDAITLANQPFVVKFTDPRTVPAGKTYNANLFQMVWGTGAFANTQTYGSGFGQTTATSATAATPVTISGATILEPGGMPAVASGGTFTLTVRLQHDKNENRFPAAATPSALQSICLAYTIPSETGVVKKCNLVGTTTNNPLNCN